MVPAVGHIYYNADLPQDRNALGQNREILMTLVPECTRARVPISLYVQDEYGKILANFPLGWFRIDQSGMVPGVIY
jgi:hypothetical protein